MVCGGDKAQAVQYLLKNAPQVTHAPPPAAERPFPVEVALMTANLELRRDAEKRKGKPYSVAEIQAHLLPRVFQQNNQTGGQDKQKTVKQQYEMIKVEMRMMKAQMKSLEESEDAFR